MRVQKPPNGTAVGKRDARYRRSDELIQKALCESLRERRLGITIEELCRLAKIARPTFYAHYKTIDLALRTYEMQLLQKLKQRLPARNSKDMIFTIFLSFIRENQVYFEATIESMNYWFLKEGLQMLRNSLASLQISDQVYNVYIHHQITIIAHWVQFEKCSVTSLPSYARKMMITRMQNV